MLCFFVGQVLQTRNAIVQKAIICFGYKRIQSIQKKNLWFSFYQESCSPCIHLYNLYVDLVSRDQVLYLNLRIMTPFCASYFYVYLTWEPGEGIADTLGNIVSSALSFLLLSVSFSFHCFASLLQREEGDASSV